MGEPTLYVAGSERTARVTCEQLNSARAALCCIKACHLPSYVCIKFLDWTGNGTWMRLFSLKLIIAIFLQMPAAVDGGHRVFLFLLIPLTLTQRCLGCFCNLLNAHVASSWSQCHWQLIHFRYYTCCTDRWEQKIDASRSQTSTRKLSRQFEQTSWNTWDVYSVLFHTKGTK